MLVLRRLRLVFHRFLGNLVVREEVFEVHVELRHRHALAYEGLLTGGSALVGGGMEMVVRVSSRECSRTVQRLRAEGGGVAEACRAQTPGKGGFGHTDEGVAASLGGRTFVNQISKDRGGYVDSEVDVVVGQL